MEKREIGRTGLKVPAIAFGTSGLGNMPDTYGYEVGEERALATVRAILDLPDGFLDTSRNYGLGRSEERVGMVVRERGGWPAGRVLSTKLDRDGDGRFDGAVARRSLEASLTALGVDRIDILHLHDPEHAADLSEITGKGGAAEALMRIKEEGLATAVGLAAGRVDVMMPILRDFDFDVAHHPQPADPRQPQRRAAAGAGGGAGRLGAECGALCRGRAGEGGRATAATSTRRRRRRCWRRCGRSRRSARGMACRRGRWRSSSRCATRG